MKFTLLIHAILILSTTGCILKKRYPEEIYIDQAEFLVKDSSTIDSIKSKIQLDSNRTSSSFKTHVEAFYLENGIIVDSIVESEFNMMSWYSSHQDTISLVAHLDFFETSALLLRFVDGKVNISCFRAPHSDRALFRLDQNDPFSIALAIPPMRYKVQLSGIPDTINKPFVFGYVDMESLEYYDKRDSLNQKHNTRMKFYFRSQFRRF